MNKVILPPIVIFTQISAVFVTAVALLVMLKAKRKKGFSDLNKMEFFRLKEENNNLISKLKNLEDRITLLNKEIEGRESEGGFPKKRTEAQKENMARREGHLETVEQKRKRIGEILLEHNYITRDILNKALKHQEQFGGSITQYLLGYGYIDEKQLAQCLCTQFGIPYLPLASCNISEDVIKLVPVDLAEKYWLMPVDRQGDHLMVVMADPLDTNAIREVESVTGYKLQRFVGILSEIIDALENYYSIIINENSGSHGAVTFPFFIDTANYKGIERRRSVRFQAKIDIGFPVGDSYKRTKTKNVGRDGFLLESTNISPQMGTLLPLEIILPKDVSLLPISAIAQVVRVVPLARGVFDVGVKTIKISKEELISIIEYASAFKE